MAMPTKRQVVIDAVEFRRPVYVPWAWGMNIDCAERVRKYLGKEDLSGFVDSHFADFGAVNFRAGDLDATHVRDVYGVVWDRSVDKDIGTPCDWPIKRPEDLVRYKWPDPDDPAWYEGIAEGLAANPDRFRRYCLGFSLFERAWTMRGMENLLTDMVERPAFVEELLDAIVENNLRQLRRGLAFGVNGVHLGDDYGMQTGLIMGAAHWRRFFKPRLARMFAAIRRAGALCCLHSCGRVQEIFDDLVEIGLNVFNPFQPEVMDVFETIQRYRGRLAFHGGMSIQKILPFGTVPEVRAQTRRLIQAGRDGGYVFSPSHSVPRDVPPENLVAMVEELKAQPGYRP
jgi:uroporphyrinogen decarboxylase